MTISAGTVRAAAQRKLNYLLQMNDAGNQRALLATIRRGAGTEPGEIPELWGLLLADVPEEFYSASGKPSRAEFALYTALVLFAVHQQGKDPAQQPMHVQDARLGAAAAKLVHSEDDLERVLRKFNIAATSDDIRELSRHLLSMVQLLRSESIPVDYAALAADLYQFQFTESRSDVRLRWGQDFYRERNRVSEEKKGESDEKE